MALTKNKIGEGDVFIGVYKGKRYKLEAVAGEKDGTINFKMVEPKSFKAPADTSGAIKPNLFGSLTAANRAIVQRKIVNGPAFWTPEAEFEKAEKAKEAKAAKAEKATKKAPAKAAPKAKAAAPKATTKAKAKAKPEPEPEEEEDDVLDLDDLDDEDEDDDYEDDEDDEDEDEEDYDDDDDDE